MGKTFKLLFQQVFLLIPLIPEYQGHTRLVQSSGEKMTSEPVILMFVDIIRKITIVYFDFLIFWKIGNDSYNELNELTFYTRSSVMLIMFESGCGYYTKNYYRIF